VDIAVTMAQLPPPPVGEFALDRTVDQRDRRRLACHHGGYSLDHRSERIDVNY
jgi:hypothetical protein